MIQVGRCFCKREEKLKVINATSELVVGNKLFN